jgi:hypothetical protein
MTPNSAKDMKIGQRRGHRISKNIFFLRALRVLFRKFGWVEDYGMRFVRVT